MRCFPGAGFLTLLSAAILAVPVSAEPAETIRIGILPALTGPFADIGSDCVRGVELAKRNFTEQGKVGNYQIELVQGDSQADAKVALNEFHRLVDREGVLAIITMRSSICMPLNPLSRKESVSLLGACGHDRFVPDNDYAFQFWPNVDQEGALLANFMLAHGQKNAAAITVEDEWNISLTRKFREAFLAGGGTMVFEQTIPATEADISPLISRLRAKAPDATFVNLGLFPGAAAFRRLFEQQLTGPRYSNYWIGDASAIKAAGVDAVEGVLFAEARLSLPKFQAELDRLGETKRPSGMTLSCYSSLAAIAQTLRGGSGIHTKQALRDGLSRLTQIDLLDGPLPIMARSVRFELLMKRIEHGQISEIK